ncbi:TetR/AcrR family transcriptional regulator [Gordonia sp. (in: high G+C Gram-positive bacteria)]|jgi:AcrR family transcriptional regulator|uniref:TetR/AcrR family transcriptional regulator n=1 Tax=Gordonia sp. (in: high G+C Gram-positive bacteria) TaxID=84139 RepID=UPI001D5C4BA2|nr:TetR/AcrR family transcriptional regulator [Gordonia sp. (in: high G+C Gram-positive bacteria)]MCB1294036.1 TetR/AcrR family transcriptional regulator [Gordonia sp. (in: high G+C Gram-positive bacteria)]HMS76715.1 TetR/AcrR family transcriptional regulator [Gordonia sp. (in: high G+C Gram-positive bacteria)]
MTGPQFATRRRTELFDALVRLFLADGFAHLTLDEIAASLKCSKSTLYTLAGSKEQLVRAATIHFFRRATEDVEAQVAATSGARDRIIAYVSAVGTALGGASAQFMTDLDGFAPAREVYEQNTRFAAARVAELVDAGVRAGEFRDVHAAFAADVAAATMARIQQGLVREATGLDDAHAYRELATLLTAGLTA